MRPVAPRTGAPEETYAEDQEEYLPITVGRYQYPDGSRGLLTRWKPTDDERKALLAGEDIYVMQFYPIPCPMTPLVVRVGPGEFKVVD